MLYERLGGIDALDAPQDAVLVTDVVRRRDDLHALALALHASGL